MMLAHVSAASAILAQQGFAPLHPVRAPIWGALILMVAAILVVIATIALPRKWKLLPVGCLAGLILVGFFVPLAVRTSYRPDSVATVVHYGYRDELPSPAPIMSAPPAAYSSAQAEAGFPSQAEAVDRPPPPAPPNAAADLAVEGDAAVYPSARSAAIGLCKKLFRSLELVIPNGERLTHVHLWAPGDTSLPGEVAQAVRPFIGSAQIVVMDGQHAQEPGHVAVDMQVLGEDEDVPLARSPGSKPRPAQRTLQVTLRGTGGERQELARIRPTPWLEDLDSYRRNELGGKEAMIVPSDLSSTREDALRQAEQQAAQALLPLVQRELARSHPPLAGRAESEKDWLRRRLQEDISHGRLILDRFEQPVTRPRGLSYSRQFLLVDGSQQAVRELVNNEYAPELDRRLSAFTRSILSAGGLVLVICLMYLFLNAATKGYYAWVLRLAGAMAVVAGIALVLAIA